MQIGIFNNKNPVDEFDIFCSALLLCLHRYIEYIDICLQFYCNSLNSSIRSDSENIQNFAIYKYLTCQKSLIKAELSEMFNLFHL